MIPLILHDEHQALGACFLELNGAEMVSHYGDPEAEYAALRNAAGLVDLSNRGRLAMVGTDRQRFLNGQVTNNVRDLRPGEGCYAAVVNAKGRVQGDLNIYCLKDELLLDCEPGHGANIAARLDQFIIADDVRMVDLSADYGLFSVQGPRSMEALASAFPGRALPEQPWGSVTWADAEGELCVTNLPRSEAQGFELFVPRSRLGSVWTLLDGAVTALGGGRCGWQCLEWARVEAGLPRYGQDMDDRNLAPEAGIEARAISYTKGCYVGQEVISRIRSIGKLTRSLQGLELEGLQEPLPQPGDQLLQGGREVGYLTSVIRPPAAERAIALGYVRKEASASGALLEVQTRTGPRPVRLRGRPGAGTGAKSCP